MMANEASTPMCLHTSLIDVFFFVAFGAIIHFHAIPGIALDSANVMTPDIAAIAGDPVFLIRLQAFGFANVTVAGNAVHATFFNVGGMGKKDAGWLPRIDQPRNFTAFLHILCNEVFFGLAFALHFFMAVDALGQLRNT